VPRLPIVPHASCTPRPYLHARALALAERLRTTYPDLIPRGLFRPLIPTTLDDAPALHLDDLSTITRISRFYDPSYLEDRAVFRAMPGDLVASCAPGGEAFEAYVRDQLGLGTVTWYRPTPLSTSLGVATACWADRGVRRDLIGAIRRGNLRYVHPHLGNAPAWTTALLLRNASRRPISVIGPHPGLTRRVNDKVWFAEVARGLFGHAAVPPTAAAYNLATVAMVVRSLCTTSRRIVFKLPSSAGGSGNLVVPSRELRGRSLGTLRSDIRNRLAELGWTGEGPLLVGAWETDVLQAPSTQLWIPPENVGLPVVEGVFQQLIEGDAGAFTGSRPADLPPDLTQAMVEQSWLLGRLFQRLGYVGRCSFDLLLVGRDLDNCRTEFIECNGRWGGTSGPMTLMNRLFGDWTCRPYATNECEVAGLGALSFSDVLEAFGDDLYDARTGTGSLIFYNPGALQSHQEIDVLVLDRSWEAAARRANRDIPRRLRALTRLDGARARRLAQIG